MIKWSLKGRVKGLKKPKAITTDRWTCLKRSSTHLPEFRGHQVLSSSSSVKRTSSHQPYCTAVHLHIHIQHSVMCKDSRA